MMAGRYQAYPEYKDSGVEWLGEVPAHWAALKIKHLLMPKKGAIKTGPFGSHLKGDDMKGGEYKVVNQRSVIDNEFNSGDYFVSQRKYLELIGFKIFPDDILVTTRGTIGRTAIAPKNLRESILHPCLMRLQINRNRYVNELIALIIQDAGYFLEQLKILSNTTTIDVIYSDTLKNVEITLPQTVEEQAKILQFLDHETAKIDTLIEKQQQLIKLLKEKRQAVISHAVTKGLNPDAPMRDSGVEWLGEVPEHWEVGYSKWLFSERNTKALSNDEMLTASQKYGVISQKEFMRLEQQKVVQVQKGHNILKHVEPQDFVISMRSFQGGIEYCPHKGAVSSAYVPLEPVKVVCIDYFKYLFKSKPYIQALQSTTNLVRDGQALRYNNFIQVRLPLVPEKEQQQIARCLDSETVKMDELMKKARESIELSKERRIALISAAVTGKIDVRNWQAPEQNQNNEENAA